MGAAFLEGQGLQRILGGLDSSTQAVLTSFHQMLLGTRHWELRFLSGAR